LETARYKTVNRAADTQPAAARHYAQTAAVAPCNGIRLQTAAKVSSPRDPAEQEAESTSKKIMRMAVPESSIASVKTSGGDVFRQVKQEEKDKKLQPKLQSPYLTRFADSGVFAQRREDTLQRKAEGQAPIAPKVSADIQASMATGTALPVGVRRFMEPRFRADFGQVKIHTGDKSAKLNRQLNAKAFTVGNQIFFGKDQFKPESQEGQGLIAHELTHTIQQGGSVQRSVEPVVHAHSEPHVQRLFGIDTDPRAYLAKKADEIPGFAMLTVVIGYNPITNAKVDRSAGNLLRGAIKMIPVAGGYIAEALENHGIFDKVSQFVAGQFDTLKDIGSSLIANIEAFIKDVSITDLVHPGEVIDRGKRIVTNAIDRIIAFATGLKNTVVTLIKDAILKPLAAFAKKNAPNGYDLLSAVLGKDPISGETVEQSAENLIAPFMKMIGQEEVWNNMKEAKAIPRCWAWYQTEKGKVKALVQELPTEFVNAFKSLDVIDIVLLPKAFVKLAVVFGGVAAKFIKWGGEAVWNLLEIIFDVLAPTVMPYVKKAQAAFKTILKDPIGFVGNLVRAGKQGFEMFAGNILEHLKAALIKWIVGPLADVGVYIPKAFSLIEIVKLVLSVLGLTWQNIRGKLVKIIPEPVLVGLEKTASILVTLVKDGPAAAWEQIKAELSELKDQLIAQVSEMVTTEVVKAAVMKLVSMLNPAGAVVQAIIAVYNTVTFFIDKAKQIAAVVAAFIDSIASIAAGQVSAAASKVEQTLANTLTVVIAFLAKFAGLGGIPAKVTGIIKKIRKPIDKGLDKIVAWLGKMLQKVGSAVAQAGLPADPNERLKLGLNAASSAVSKLPGKRIGRALIVPLLGAIKLRYGFTSLEPEIRDGQWWIKGVINPPGSINSGKQAGTPISPEELAAITRRVVLSEIQDNPAIRKRIQQPVGPTIVIADPSDLPAAALQSRVQLDQHRVASGPPFTVLAGTQTNQVNIEIGGGVVTEKRARAGASGAPLEKVMGFEGQGHYSPDVLNEIKNSGISEQAFALNMKMLTQTGSMEPGLNDRQRASIRKVTWLLFGTESARNIANIAHAPMVTGMVETGKAGFSEVLSSKTKGVSGGMLPATMGQLPATARTLDAKLSQTVPGLIPRVGGQTASDDQFKALPKRENNLVMLFVAEKTESSSPSKEDAENVIRAFVRQYYLIH
jgi:hypothetical protein